jgi:tetratricopeptide (TPR) repeat protein
MLRSQSVALVLGMCLGSFVAAQPADTRAPIPQKADTMAAEKLIRDIFKADFAKTKAADRTALAQKLLEQADGTKDDNAARYVLIQQARDLATKAGDCETFLKAAEALAKAFNISLSESQTAGVDALAANLTATGARDAGQPLLDAADAALAAGEFDAAQKLLRAADAAGRKGSVATVTSSVAARTKSLVTLRKDFEKLGDARKKLETAPTDPEANLIVGRYLCFVKNDWEGGLPRLVLGSDATLKAAAEKDDKANSGSSADKAEAADNWYKLGTSAEAMQKSSLMSRALLRYREAQSEATGLAKVKIEKRIEELAKLAPNPAVGAGGGAAGWDTIRQALKGGSAREWPTVGSVPVNYPKFGEAPAAGGILIGFRFAGTATHIEWLQPIYLGAKGEFNGAAFGRPKVPVNVIKAKEGYAIGSILIHSAGRYLYGFEPNFVKLNKTTLDPSDAYRGAAVGSSSGTRDTVGDGSSPIVGIHGRINPSTAVVTTFSVTTLPVGDAPAPKTKKTK